MEAIEVRRGDGVLLFGLKEISENPFVVKKDRVKVSFGLRFDFDAQKFHGDIKII